MYRRQCYGIADTYIIFFSVHHFKNRAAVYAFTPDRFLAGIYVSGLNIMGRKITGSQECENDLGIDHDGDHIESVKDLVGAGFFKALYLRSFPVFLKPDEFLYFVRS